MILKTGDSADCQTLPTGAQYARMSRLLLVVLSLCSLILASSRLLSTRQGQLQGRVLRTPSTGREYFAFTAIPYAKPPLGSLRLRNPVPHGGWSGVLDATQPAPLCTQTGIFVPATRNVTTGQEDCLYLNIFTPSIDPSSKLPILVYIHGGGFRSGGPPPGDLAPTNFMEGDVVLATVHYRLGSLGFLSTESSEIPGNFGLKDQALAIQWLSQNVAHFGGDPARMAVFGESAGGASVHYLITSPLSRDLLSGAIAESGVIDAPWSLAPTGRASRLARKLGELVGCTPDEQFLECLQEVEAEKLISAETQFLVWDFDPAIVFQPVVEVENEGAFMTEDPRAIGLSKPLIAGVLPGEGLFKTASLVNGGDSLIDEFVQNIDSILPPVLFLEPDTPNLEDFLSAIKSRYFKELSNRQSVVQGLEDISIKTTFQATLIRYPVTKTVKKLYRDIFFIYPMHLALVRHEGPKFGYLFAHRHENTLAALMGPKVPEDHRPSHGDDLLSLFNWTLVFPNSVGRPEDRAVTKRVVEMWINFAKTQNPTPEGSDVTWKEYAPDNKILQIKTEADQMITCPYLDVVEFWDKTVQILNSPVIVKEEL